MPHIALGSLDGENFLAQSHDGVGYRKRRVLAICHGIQVIASLIPQTRDCGAATLADPGRFDELK